MSRVATLLTVSILINQVVGVVCQFIQGTDPRFPLLYFSVDSAVWAALAAVSTLAGCSGAAWQRLRLAAVVGVALSAIVFVFVIVPATETGTWFQPHDDLPVRTATLLIHGVAPVLVIAEYLLRPAGLPVSASILWSYPWPLAYLAGTAVLAVTLDADALPYPFLLPSMVGWPTVVGACLSLAALVGLLGWAFGTLDWVIRRPVTAAL